MKSPKLSSMLFGVAIICFFLPFVTLSCGGQRTITFSGMQMAIGTTVDEPQLFGAPQKKPIEPNPFVSLALLCSLLGAFLGLATTSALPPAVSGVVGGLALLLAKERLDEQVLRQGHGVLQVNTEAGYFLTLFLFVSVAAWNAYLLWVRHERKQLASVGDSRMSSRREPPE